MSASTDAKNGFRRIVTFLLFFIIMAAAIPAASDAASISFGPYFYYAAWEPFYKDNLLSKNNSQSYTWKHRFTMDPAPLYGFSLGFSFAERWNASAVFVTGRYVSRFSYLAASYLAPAFVALMGGSGFVTPTEISSRQSTNKYDLDATLSCGVTAFMKVFIGFKYQHYTIAEGPYNVPMRLISTGPDTGNYWIYNDTRITYNGYAGGIGVSFSAHVVENLFFFFNVSALYQYPQMTANNSFFIAFFGSGGGFILPLNFKDALHNQRKNRLVYNAVGGNVTTSFAYQIPAAHLTLSLGARYQYLYFMGTDASGFKFNGKSDHYYGGTFSAIFSFDLNKETKPSDSKES